MLYFLKAGGSRISNITFWPVNWSTCCWSTRPDFENLCSCCMSIVQCPPCKWGIGKTKLSHLRAPKLWGEPFPTFTSLTCFLHLRRKSYKAEKCFPPWMHFSKKGKFWGLWLICRWQSEWQSVWDWMLSQAVCSVAGVPWIRGSQLHSPTVPRKVQSATVPRIRYIRANDGGQPQGANQWRHHVVSTEILG